MLKIVLTPKIFEPPEIGGPRLKPFSLMVNPHLRRVHKLKIHMNKVNNS